MTQRSPCIVVTILCCLLTIVLWEKVEDTLYTKPLSTHWFNFTCVRAAQRWKVERPSTSELALATRLDSSGRLALGMPPYRLSYECWPDTLDPRGPKGK